MNALTGWENFYVIVGSSAGALIGLQFVVMTLIAEIPANRTDAQAGQAFGTPNVVHFGVVLFLSAIISAPWEGIGFVATLFGLVGVGGIVYAIFIARRMRSQKVYKPVFEDWLFHRLLPFVAYAMLAIAACIAPWHARRMMFIAATSSLLLLFIGIHNAWDTVVWNVFSRNREQHKDNAEK